MARILFTGRVLLADVERDVLKRELRKGIAETRRYLLSHHEPEEYDRCHRVRIGSRPVHLCARCSGIYPGILVGVGWFLLGSGSARIHLVLIAILPIFALVDWAITAFRPISGSNAVRTITGGLLGIAYGLGLGRLLLGGDLRVLVVGAGYAVLAVIALSQQRSRTS
ncbi:DUF2085 domain-containing protein [Halopenitus sp. H-Gu1]|uniref:DUF2085 domain-containing protein n=1 Tax=Halopenitus sp. H-Gu1 TaxID=3242697 RepID=UPI00359D859A